MLGALLAQNGLTVYLERGYETARWRRRRDLLSRVMNTLFIFAVIVSAVVIIIDLLTPASHAILWGIYTLLLLGGILTWGIFFLVDWNLKKGQDAALATVVTRGKPSVALLLLKVGTIRGGYILLSVFGQGSVIKDLTVLKCTEKELPSVLLRNFQEPLIVTAATIEVASASEVGPKALENLFYSVGRTPDRKEIKQVLHDLETDQIFVFRG